MRPAGHPHNNTARWKSLSKRIRAAQPWCLDCGRRDDLCADHIISIDERPDLALEPLNITVRCRYHNGLRANNCTGQERQAVLEAIEAQRQRRQRFYLTELAS